MPQKIITDGIRLNKALADAGLCSRRGADELVFAGQVFVNGVLADSPGIRVVPGQDKIYVSGREIKLAAPDRQTVCLVLNKPIQVVSSAKDPEGRPTVLDYVPAEYQDRRLYPVGRLDYFSDGLILLTDDGDLAFAASHPSRHLPKVYRLLVRSVPEAALDKALQTMRKGMTLAEGERLAPVDITRQPDQGNAVVLELTLIQGLNRQIRRMCRDLDLTILKLTRISQGPIKLGDLKPGQTRPLSETELQELRKQLRIKR